MLASWALVVALYLPKRYEKMLLIWCHLFQYVSWFHWQFKQELKQLETNTYHVIFLRCTTFSSIAWKVHQFWTCGSVPFSAHWPCSKWEWAKKMSFPIGLKALHRQYNYRVCGTAHLVARMSYTISFFCNKEKLLSLAMPPCLLAITAPLAESLE